jgi:hypothetical protein
MHAQTTLAHKLMMIIAMATNLLNTIPIRYKILLQEAIPARILAKVIAHAPIVQ